MYSTGYFGNDIYTQVREFQTQIENLANTGGGAQVNAETLAPFLVEYAKKTELPVVPDLSPYALKTEIPDMSGKADKLYVDDKLLACVQRVNLQSDVLQYNPTLQPVTSQLSNQTTEYVSITANDSVPHWQYDLTGGSSRNVFHIRTRVASAWGSPNPPTSPNLFVFTIRGLTTSIATNPGYVQQTRSGLQPGVSYGFRVRCAFRDWQSNVQPLMRMRLTDTSDSTVLAERSISLGTDKSQSSLANWNLYELAFVAPVSGSIIMQIANMGPDTTIGANTNADTYIWVAEAYLVRLS